MFWLNLFSKKGCLTLIVFFVIIVIALIKCEGKKTEDSHQLYSQLLSQCEAACEVNDYEKAYNILAKIRESFSDKRPYNNAKRKVFEREVNYLVSVNNDDAGNRIAYLLTENLHLAPKPMPEGTYDDISIYNLKDYNENVRSSNGFCDKIFLLAASQGNKYLCKKLLYFYREEAVYQKVEKNNSKDSQKDTKDDNDPKESYIVSYNNSAKEAAIEKYKDFFGEEPDLKQVNTNE